MKISRIPATAISVVLVVVSLGLGTVGHLGAVISAVLWRSAIGCLKAAMWVLE